MNEREIFIEALQKEGSAERSAFLDAACGEDAELRGLVDQLFAEHEKKDSFFIDSPPPGVAVTTDRPVPEEPGTQIGPYKLLQKIGEGGMGVVYMAEQTEPVERRVALKIIRPGMDTRQVIARFEAERQALAMMDHPNIARVLDAGTTGGGARGEGRGARGAKEEEGDSHRPDSSFIIHHSSFPDPGRPYFVMELVKGVPITEYCDQHHLSPRERLELFVPVCQAVQHAHQKGIIHRDIKPSNVMVAEYDDRAVPKIIDFGVAKAIEQRLTERTMFTQLGQVVGTLDYMSPEQAKLNQLDVDTRSDIYALGVLLYELLAGELPFDRERLRSAAFDELLRIIREEEPPKPSTRLSTSRALPSIAANRRIEPKRLSTLVRGELDWIVMKALEKDRTRRYETAAGFAADVVRYLNDEPVEACPPSTVYRFKKFARRHKAGLGSVAVMALGVLTALVVLAVTSARIKTAHNRTEDALRRESRAGDDLRRALARERRTLYFHRVALAHRQLADNYVRAARQQLDACPEPLRDWEWYHLDWLLDRSLRTLDGHTHRVLSVAIRPDGKRIASGGWDGTVRIWEAETGEPVCVLPARHDEHGDVDFVRSVAYSPSGTRIAAATGRGVRIWDCRTREVEREIDAHRKPVNSVAFSTDGRWLVSAGDDGTVKVWNAESGDPVQTLSGHGDRVLSAAFSPDGDTIASGSEDRSVKLWNAATGELTKTIGGATPEADPHAHRLGVTSLAFSPHGKRLVSGSFDNTIKLWNLPSGEHLSTIRGHRHWIASVAFDPTGNRIVSACADNSCKIWDALTGAELLNLRGHRAPVSAAAFTADGRRVVSAGWDNAVKLWDATAHDEVPTIQAHADVVTCVAFSPDGRRFASSGHDGAIKLWDPVTGQEERTLLTDGEPIHWLAFSPDGTVVASAGEDAMVRLWDLETGAEIGALADHAGPALAVAFSPDGRRLASGSSDKTLKIWDHRAGRLEQTIHGHAGGVYALDYSPDGRRIATAGLDHACKIWDADKGEELFAFRGHTGPVGSVVFSRDGSKIASACPFSAHYWIGEVKLWDAKDGTELPLGPAGNQAPRSSVAFSPDSRRIVASGNDRSLMLWDVVTGEEALMLRGHRREVIRAVFSPDGRRIVSGCYDGTIKIWETTKPR